MSAATPHPRQALIASWLAQLIGTVALAAVVLAFVKATGTTPAAGDTEWNRYALYAILLSTAPALVYLRAFKARLDADDCALRARGEFADPALRKRLKRSLSVGGALCEIPQALGLFSLLIEGQTRWFIFGSLLTIAIRLSYRPFTRLSR
ncbi:MAG TPA: hypothetical protein VN878_04635 [Usitatibacter sp.]|nr:hypothetical protein [Usitatibacter sp.]